MSGWLFSRRRSPGWVGRRKDEGEVENYEDIYLLCYVRGREGIITALAERIG